jgi:hypothetical protein
MNRIISNQILQEVIGCIAQATHNYPYAKVNQLIHALENLPDQAKSEETTAVENPS